MADFGLFSVFDWIDGMQKETCRPGGVDKKQNRRVDEFNGHSCLKNMV